MMDVMSSPGSNPAGEGSGPSAEPPPGPPPPPDRPGGRELAHLGLMTLGVVYGDIGTSPLYAVKECFGEHGVQVSQANVMGVLSLIVWALVLIISIKYMVFILRADNRGEGGILALMALLTPSGDRREGWPWVVAILGLFGAALLYGDGVITPAISVLGAMEGLKVYTPELERYVIPLTIAVLIGLFSIQRHGTAVVGVLFGPIMIVWFTTMAVLGIASVLHNPHVLAAISPHHALNFLAANGTTGYLVLGAVFLVVTGGEAIYADMGHLGPRPIRLDWFGFVLPALLLNYFGQGALLLADPGAASNPFYNLAPAWGVVPLVVLATMAAVIASQAVISGVFSLTMQAVQLGYAPRTTIDHTSERQMGQIFVPAMNWALMIGTIALVLGFGSTTRLAAAYGLSVNLDMLITTLLFGALAHRVWKWPLWRVLLLGGIFLIVELAFFGANVVKFFQGGWFPLVVAGVLFTIATTWKLGRSLLGQRMRGRLMPLEAFVANVRQYPPHRVDGTAVFLSSNPHSVPLALAHNLKHNKVLHKRVVFLTILSQPVPRVPSTERIEYRSLGDDFHQIIARYGFMQEPHVPMLLEASSAHGLKFNIMDTTFFLGRESLLATRKPGMAIWRERLFVALSRNAQPATAFFHIPPNRVIEVGAQIEL